MTPPKTVRETALKVGIARWERSRIPLEWCVQSERARDFSETLGRANMDGLELGEMEQRLDIGAMCDRPRRRISAALSLLERYFVSFGLPDGAASRAAAQSVLLSVLRRNPPGSPDDFDRYLLTTAREWIRVFSSGLFRGEADWLWGAFRMLRRFPETFLCTPLPLPEFGERDEVVRVPLLPPSDFYAIRQQEIQSAVVYQPHGVASPVAR